MVEFPYKFTKGGSLMDEVKILAMLQEISEKFDTMNDLLQRIESNTSSTESNTSYMYGAKSEIEDLNTKAQKIINIIEQ